MVERKPRFFGDKILSVIHTIGIELWILGMGTLLLDCCSVFQKVSTLTNLRCPYRAIFRSRTILFGRSSHLLS